MKRYGLNKSGITTGLLLGIFCGLIGRVSVSHAQLVQNFEPLGANRYSIHVSDKYPQTKAILQQYFEQAARTACQGSVRIVILEQANTSDQMIGIVECQGQTTQVSPQRTPPKQPTQQVLSSPLPRETSVPSPTYRAQSASAERIVQFGVQGSYGEDTDFGVGGRIIGNIGQLLGMQGIEAIGSFDYFFPDCGSVDCSYFEVNGNVVYRFPLQQAIFSPYVGGGLNVAHGSVDFFGLGEASDTKFGFNLLGGAKFHIGIVQPFAEFRFEIEGGEQFVITGGVLF